MGNLPILAICFVCCCLFLTLKASGVGPNFVNSPEPIVAPLGDEVEFECSLDVPADQIKWKHNQRLLPVAFNNTTRSQFIFKMEAEAQVGDYQCIACYGASALASIPAKLSLAKLGPVPSPLYKTYLISPGNNIVINCSLPYSNPAPVVQYFKNNKTIPGAVILDSGALLLTNLQPNNSGQYTCAVTNDYVNPSTVTLPSYFNVNVVEMGEKAPQFSYLPQENYSVQKGSNVTLECVAFGEPVPVVSWSRKDGRALPVNRTKRLKAGLRLFNVGPEDEGDYVCTVDNNVRPSLEHKISLTVMELPKIVHGPENDRVKEGGRIILECLVEGKPLPTISWLLNGNSVTNDPYARIINGSALELIRVEKRHAGWYQCLVENSLGATFGASMLLVVPKQVTLNSSTDLDMPVDTLSKHNPPPIHKKHPRKHKNSSKEMVPPSKPTVTRLTDTSVMVRWHVPPNTGLPILFFKVQHRELSKGKNSRWMTNNGDIPPHVGSYEVTGLTPGADYRFRIAAVYSNMDNKLSANSLKFHLQSGTTSRQVPPAPRLTHTTSAGPEAINIFWELPMRSGPGNKMAAVEGFYVYYRSTSNAGDYMKRTVEGANTRSCIITHLQPDTAYEVKVQSFTVNAASEFSEILTQKTERLSTQIPSITETPIQSPPHDISVEHKSGNQLYVTLGAVLGVLALLLTLCTWIFCCNKHRQHHTTGSDEDEADKSRHIQMEAIHHVNGHVVGGSGVGSPRGASDGISLQQKKSQGTANGCCNSAGKSKMVNITSNPMDVEETSAKAQNVMEIAFITTNSCEENCSSSVLTARLASSSAVLPSCAMESETWRRTELPRTVDNYV